MDNLKKINGCCSPSEEITRETSVKRMMEIQYLLTLEIMKRTPYTHERWDYCQDIIQIFMKYYESEDDTLS